MQNLGIALDWVRTSFSRGRHFITFPHSALRLNNDNILKRVSDKISQGMADQFVPSPVKFMDVPKPHSGTRLVPILDVDDEVIISWGLLNEYDKITKLTNKSSHTGKPIEYKVDLPDDPASTEWIEYYLKPWDDFEARARQHLLQGDRVLSLDIKNFARSVDTDRLLNQMENMGFSQASLKLFSDYFEGFKAQGLPGIPAGSVITDVLNKIYLAHLDQYLEENFPYEYYRYSDDIQIVLKEGDDPEQAKALLSDALEEFGLSLNEKKTKLLTKDDLETDDNSWEAVKKLAAQTGYFRDASSPTRQELRRFYNEYVVEKLENGEGISSDYAFNKLFIYTIYEMRDLGDATPLKDMALIMDRYPKGMSHMINMADALDVWDGMDDVMEIILLADKDSSYHDYYMFNKISKAAVHHQKEALLEKVACMTITLDMPDYQRQFINSCRDYFDAKPRSPRTNMAHIPASTGQVQRLAMH